MLPITARSRLDTLVALVPRQNHISSGPLLLARKKAPWGVRPGCRAHTSWTAPDVENDYPALTLGCARAKCVIAPFLACRPMKWRQPRPAGRS